MLAAPRTDPGERNYRTGLLPRIMTSNRQSGQGCRSFGLGNQRAAIRIILWHVSRGPLSAKAQRKECSQRVSFPPPVSPFGTFFSPRSAPAGTRRMRAFLAIYPNHARRSRGPFWAVFRLSPPPFSGSASIGELLDVDISGIATGQQLAWNGSALVHVTEPFDVGLHLPDLSTAGALLAEIVLARPVDFPAAFAGVDRIREDRCHG